MKQTILITGISGFASSHLVDYILQNVSDVKIVGTFRNSNSNFDNINHNLDKISLLNCDLLNSVSINNIVKSVKPHKIFHLAAQSNLNTSWAAPGATFNNNIMSQYNLLEAVKNHCCDARIICAGSSEMYGAVSLSELPVTEDVKLQPLSPYAVSKASCDMMAYQYFRNYNLQTIRTRAFNHSGPRRPAEFVDSAFAKQIAEIELKLREPVLRHGNLEAIRDFVHVSDVATSYWIASEKCKIGEAYNICTGVGTRIYDVLVKLLTMTKVDIKTELDKTKLRPSDIPIMVGNASKFRNETGWQSQFSIDDALIETLDYWREKLSRK